MSKITTCLLQLTEKKKRITYKAASYHTHKFTAGHMFKHPFTAA